MAGMARRHGTTMDWFGSIDFSNLRNDSNWRDTLLNNAIYTKGLGNLTDADIQQLLHHLG